RSGIVQQLIEDINGNLTELNYNEEVVKGLLETEINRFNEEVKCLEFIKIDYSQYLGNEQVLDVSTIINRFKNNNHPLKNDSAIELIEAYFPTYFREYFDNEFNQIDSVSIENIEAKKRYLAHKQALNQNQLLKEKSTKLLAITKSRDESGEISKKLN